MDGSMYGGMALSPQLAGYGGVGMGGVGSMGMNQNMGQVGMGTYGGGGRSTGVGAGGPRPSYQGGGMNGAGGGGGFRRMDDQVVEGKLFLGGLDTNTSKEIVLEYVTQWYVRHLPTIMFHCASEPKQRTEHVTRRAPTCLASALTIVGETYPTLC